MDNKYDDIINMPHHVSHNHKPMAMEARAAQFAAFAALNGYREMINDTNEKQSEEPQNDADEEWI